MPVGLEPCPTVSLCVVLGFVNLITALFPSHMLLLVFFTSKFSQHGALLTTPSRPPVAACLFFLVALDLHALNPPLASRPFSALIMLHVRPQPFHPPIVSWHRSSPLRPFAFSSSLFLYPSLFGRRSLSCALAPLVLNHAEQQGPGVYGIQEELTLRPCLFFYTEIHRQSRLAKFGMLRARLPPIFITAKMDS